MAFRGANGQAVISHGVKENNMKVCHTVEYDNCSYRWTVVDFNYAVVLTIRLYSAIRTTSVTSVCLLGSFVLSCFINSILK